ncbi:hypothetical protein ASD45_14420 [Pseudolabrys sp. Root1462]|nr:hypothetical protein ASD45_14420 [Pseudolabrys sp. Root1462]
MISENFQAKALAYDIRPEFDSKIDDLQATAERNLSTFDFVGIVERFDDSIAALSTILEAEIKIKRLNVNQRREHAPTISAEELELARKLNAIDIAVYSKARGAFQEKFHGILGNAKNEDRYFFG